VIRDTQILEKRLVKKEIEEEEKRLDVMMEIDRVNALRIDEEIERRRKEERLVGAMRVMEQIEENEQVGVWAQCLLLQCLLLVFTLYIIIFSSYPTEALLFYIIFIIYARQWVVALFQLLLRLSEMTLLLLLSSFTLFTFLSTPLWLTLFRCPHIMFPQTTGGMSFLLSCPVLLLTTDLLLDRGQSHCLFLLAKRSLNTTPFHRPALRRDGF